jgi:uncharacterized membrane protein YbhN (UPF0104 family)
MSDHPATDGGGRRPRRWLRRLGTVLSLLIVVVAIWVLATTLREIEPARILDYLARLEPAAIVIAACSSLAAFLILALNEVLAVKWLLRLRVSWRLPFVAAMTANPIGHSVGLAALSGGALRYRLYSAAGLGPATIGGIVVLAFLPYALGLTFLFDLIFVFRNDEAAALLKLPAWLLLAVGLAGIAKDIGYQALSAFRRRPLTLFGLTFNVPPLRFSLFQLVAGTVEVLLVAAILYVLLPPDASVAPLTFLTAFLAGLLLGIASNVPAGLGVLESTLLVLLPDVPPEALLASVVAYRIVFEVVPLVLALTLFGGWAAAGQLRRTR